ncbi:hypothetical protein [Caldalkalibacillus salinus]|uniref:hypothetical protein n=1 Tax=Caldalkalibacillus salinus TaxID=2803787 RepID=UPI001921FB17|nr:hypothetical protein [Caldalkalibacillus salinus]
MEVNQFKCSKNEWYFIRPFFFTPYDTKEHWDVNINMIRFRIISSIVIPLIFTYYIFIDNGSSFFFKLYFGLTASGLCVYFFVIKYDYKLQQARDKKLLIEPTEKDLIYLIIDESEIKINWLNNIQNNKALYYMPLGSLVNIKVINLKLPEEKYLSAEKELMNYIDIISQKCEGFNAEAKLRYDDKYALEITHKNTKYDSYIPIPDSWFDNGEYARLIKLLSSLTEIEVDETLLINAD